MERNELIASVKERENLRKLGHESIAQAREKGMSEKQIADTMGEGALAAYDANKASEDFGAIVVKIQRSLGLMLSDDAGLGGVVKWLGKALQHGMVLKGVMISIAAIMATSMISSLVGYITTFIGFFATKKTADATDIASKTTQNGLDTAANSLKREWKKVY